MKDDIRMGFRETEWRGVNWIHVVQVKEQWRVLMKMVKNFQMP
jgi:hypothetical protein